MRCCQESLLAGTAAVCLKNFLFAVGSVITIEVPYTWQHQMFYHNFRILCFFIFKWRDYTTAAAVDADTAQFIAGYVKAVLWHLFH